MGPLQFHRSAEAARCNGWLSSVLPANICKLKGLHEVHCLETDCVLRFATFVQISCEWRRNLDGPDLEPIGYTVVWVWARSRTYQQRWTSANVSLYSYIRASCKGCGSEAGFASDSGDRMWAAIFCSSSRTRWKEWVPSNNRSIISPFKRSMLINFRAFGSCSETKLNISSSISSLLISGLVK